MNRFSLGMTASLLALGYSTGAHAQTEAPSGTIAEVIVTAQRRAQSAQDVPVAVAAFNAEQLAQAGVRTATDLQNVVPGITMDSNGSRSPIFLRGVGNNNYGSQSSVLTFIDGVYQPFDGTGGTEFNNIETIELAKGPQGTLFGRNATGGVLQIHTRNPMDRQGLEAEVGYANYDTISGKIYAAAKTSEHAAIDVAGFYYDQNDGWGTNLFDGSDFYTTRRYGARSKFVAELDDDFTLTLSADYSNRRGQQGTGLSGTTLTPFIFDSGNNRKILFSSIYDVNTDDDRAGFKAKEGGVALTLERKIGEVNLLSISSYRRAREYFLVDIDAGPLPAFTLDRTDQRKVFTQEVQVSFASEPFTWAAGVYYYYAHSDIVGPVFGGFVPQFAFGTPPGGEFAISSEDRTNSYAAYAQGTLRILPATNLTLGARYTTEKREITGRTTGSSTLSPFSAGTQEETFKKPSIRVAIDHKFGDNVLAYVSFNRGFNAGFFSQQAFFFNDALNPVIKPEEVDAYEIGLKTDLLDRHLRVNLAAFLYDYTNLQQQIYVNNAVTTTNAAAARIKGVEFEVVARPVADLTLSVNGTYIDSNYKSYPAAPSYPMAPDGSISSSPVDASGKKVTLSPEFSLQAAIVYTYRASVGSFDSSATLNYRSKMYVDPNNDYLLPGRTLVGLSERWTSNDGNTNVTLWVQNLTDEEWDTSAGLLTPNGDAGRPAAPRTYGITVGRKF